jgi:hypothetical protein
MTRPSRHAARLYADAPRGRWVHDCPLEAGLDDAGVEAIAEALHSAAQAAISETTPPRPRCVSRIHAHESAAGIEGGETVRNPPATAACIEHADAGRREGTNRTLPLVRGSARSARSLAG